MEFRASRFNTPDYQVWYLYGPRKVQTKPGDSLGKQKDVYCQTYEKLAGIKPRQRKGKQ